MIPRFKPWLGLASLLPYPRPIKFSPRLEKAFAKKFRAVDAVAFHMDQSAQWAFFKAIELKFLKLSCRLIPVRW